MDPGGDMVDTDQLASDLEFIPMDKAKVGSYIVHRVMNAEKHGRGIGVRQDMNIVHPDLRPGPDRAWRAPDGPKASFQGG